MTNTLPLRPRPVLFHLFSHPPLMGLSNWSFLVFMFLLFSVYCGWLTVLSTLQALFMVTYVENGRNNQIIQKQYSIRISLY